ncbi:hypothetical protein YC2023_116815 [Brassica napus]
MINENGHKQLETEREVTNKTMSCVSNDIKLEFTTNKARSNVTSHSVIWAHGRKAASGSPLRGRPYSAGRLTDTIQSSLKEVALSGQRILDEFRLNAIGSFRSYPFF